MTTRQTGDEGESSAADALKRLGYKILERNWRNRWCEIDIVAEKSGTVYFAEVKYRARNDWGDGFDAIGPQKLERMARAAEAWVLRRHYEGPYELLAVAVDEAGVELRSIDFN